MTEFPPNMPLLTWLCISTLLPFIFAIININHSIQFWNLRRYQFINSRKPKLLMLYNILVSISLFLFAPIVAIDTYIQSLYENDDIPLSMSNNDWWFTCFLICECVYGSIICTLINIIAVRSWLLFYDHKFTIATVDRIWRKSINPSDNNFYLNYKKTLGNDEFFLKLVFTIWVFVLFAILLTVTVFRWCSSESIYIALRVFIAIPIAVFVFRIYYKIKSINDEFELRKEMQSLGKWVLFLTVSAIIALMLIYCGVDLYIFETVHNAIDLLFIVCTAYIQTKSVLNSFSRNLKKIKNNSSTARKYRINMVDILRNQNTFEAFMRHCVNELSVESLLFLVEIAQYKATLCKHNAPDPISQFYNINVQKVNLREILLDSRFEQRISITSATDKTDFMLTERNSSGRTKSRRSIVDFIDSRSSTLPSKGTSTGAAATARKESKFQQFQQSILERKWLPITFQVAPMNNASQSLLTHTPMTSKSMRNLRTLAESTEIKGLKLNEVASDKEDITPSVADDISDIMTKIIIHSDVGHSPGSESPKSPVTPTTPTTPSRNKKFNFKDITIINARKSPKTPRTPYCTVSSEWIRDFALFLYDKYIKDNSEHSVNISSATRRFLTQLFNQEENEMFFQFIVQHSGGDNDRDICAPAAINQQLLINTYLYHIFDEPFDEIWSLLRTNSFLRFSVTEEYKRLLREIEKDNKETNGQRLSRVMREAAEAVNS